MFCVDDSNGFVQRNQCYLYKRHQRKNNLFWIFFFEMQCLVDVSLDGKSPRKVYVKEKANWLLLHLAIRIL